MSLPAGALPVFLTTLGRMFPRCCLLPGLQPSECCSPWGCLFVLPFIMPFSNCQCGKTGMCHCFLLAAGVRKPNYQGSQRLVAIAVRFYVHVCVCWGCSGEQLCQARLAVMAGDGYSCSGDSKERERKKKGDSLIRDSSCAVCCHPGTSQQAAPTVCLLTTFNCCLML